jgi:membrane protein
MNVSERPLHIDRSAVIRCVLRESFTDRTMMVAAGLAFFVLFSLLPAIAVAGLMLSWLVGDSALEEGLARHAGLFPEETPQLLEEFLTVVPKSLSGGVGLAANLVIVLWTVQRAASGLITTLNIVYDEEERRNRSRREAVALAIAGGGLVLLFLALVLLTVLPGLAALEAVPAANLLLPMRWLLLAALFLGAAALLYRFAACRDDVSWRYILIAATIATATWIVGSLLFTAYMNNVGGWDQYYGTVTTLVVLMTWMFISSFVFMMGAELDAQLQAAAYPHKHREHTKQVLDRREEAK